jgi:hypothetical protein
MLDGKISRKEWSDARSFNAGELARLYVKQNNNDVLIAVEYLKADNFTVDLHLAPADGQVYDLHSSAKLGERVLKDNHWPEEWTWWNNDRWVATFSRVDSWEKRSFVGEKVREFQISRDRFPGKRWKIFLELMAPVDNDWKTFRYPDAASSTSTRDWISFDLN